MDDIDRLVARTVLIAIALIAAAVCGGQAIENWNTQKMADKGFCYVYTWVKCK